MTFKLFYRPGNYKFYLEGHREIQKIQACLIVSKTFILPTLLAQGYNTENFVENLLCSLGSKL